MEWLQSKDPASCAIWEWIKADCQKRDTDQLRTLSPQEMECVCRRLGVSLPTFSQVSQNLQQVGWVVDGRVKGWKKWNDRNRTPEEDALRKQVEYWKQKADSKDVAKSSQQPPQFLPNPPRPPQSEERRGEESTNTVPPTPLEAFEIFWSEYPRKMKRGDAEHAFAEVNAHKFINDIVAAIRSQKSSEGWLKDSGKFIPYPANWIRDKQWLDQANGHEIKLEEFCTKNATRFRVISNKGYIYWTRTDGGPRREQWGNNQDQEKSFQATRQAYDDWVKL